MELEENFYDLLGISKDSSSDEIKKRYKRLAMRYHPDKGACKETEEYFKKITHAYGVLGDSERKEYKRR